MLKIFLYSVLLSLSISNSNALDIKWYGTTCLSIEDEKTRLIVDPFVTRVSLFKLLTNQTVKSNKDRVKKYFGPTKKKTAILITHTHFDHVLDLAEVMWLNPEATVYGSDDVKPILKGHGMSLKRFKKVKESDKFQVDGFEIKVFKVEHSPLPFNLNFAKGVSVINEKSGVRDYKTETSLSYNLVHSTKNILIHPTAVPRTYPDLGKVDLMIVGITSRNIEKLKSEVIDKIKAKKVFPVHNENFFRDFDKELKIMPFYPVLGSFPKGKLPLIIN